MRNYMTPAMPDHQARKRSLITIALMAATFFINEVHSVLAKVDVPVNPWWFRNYPLDLQWVVKFFFIIVDNILRGVIFYRLARLNFELRMMSVFCIVMSGIDMVLFFACFNKIEVHLLLFGAKLLIAAGVFYLMAFYGEVVFLYWWEKLRERFRIRWQLISISLIRTKPNWNISSIL